MSQTFNTFAGSTTLAATPDMLNDTFAALRTLFSGSSAPSSPATYQLWLDTSGSPARLPAPWLM